tara:strand:- start:1762 stop:2322 length:561 start_codon:yes stop_codon:yes gene_type:complete
MKKYVTLLFGVILSGCQSMTSSQSLDLIESRIQELKNLEATESESDFFGRPPEKCPKCRGQWASLEDFISEIQEREIKLIEREKLLADALSPPNSSQEAIKQRFNLAKEARLQRNVDDMLFVRKIIQEERSHWHDEQFIDELNTLKARYAEASVAAYARTAAKYHQNFNKKGRDFADSHLLRHIVK